MGFSDGWFSKLSYVAHATSSNVENSFSLRTHSSHHHRRGKTTSSSSSIKTNTAKDATDRTRCKNMKIEIATILPPKDLFRLCRKGEWTLFIQKCQEESEKIFWIGPQNQTLLHFMCTRRPTKQSIIDFVAIWPEALEIEDKDGCKPIHMAMANGASHDVLCSLISPNNILHENKWHYYPFNWIWKRCKYEFMHLDTEDELEQDILWNTIDVMIHAASFQSGSRQSGSLLHKAMDFDCPIDLIELILLRFPTLLQERDSFGRTPLARALSTPNFTSLDLINILLQTQPETAQIVDEDGRTPFHLAIQSRIPWKKGVDDIFKAAPQCLFDRDPVTHLFPVQLMACNSDNEESSFTLTDIYEVLCQCPNLLS